MSTKIEITLGKILDLIEEKKRPVSIGEVEFSLEGDKEFKENYL